MARLYDCTVHCVVVTQRVDVSLCRWSWWKVERKEAEEMLGGV